MLEWLCWRYIPHKSPAPFRFIHRPPCDALQAYAVAGSVLWGLYDGREEASAFKYAPAVTRCAVLPLQCWMLQLAVRHQHMFRVGRLRPVGGRKCEIMWHCTAFVLLCPISAIPPFGPVCRMVQSRAAVSPHIRMSTPA